MSQAKTLDERELRRVLDHVATRPHAARNRAMIVMTFYAGLRVGEVSHLKMGDVYDERGAVKKEIFLDGARVKNKHARTVFIPGKLRKELTAYREAVKDSAPDLPLFPNQKSPQRGSRPIRLPSIWPTSTGMQVWMAPPATQGAGPTSLDWPAGEWE